MSTPDNSVVREAQTVENYNASAKQKAAAKLSRIPVKVEQGEVLKKPDWIRVKAGSPSTRFYEIKDVLRANKLVTVCEEASCPNIGECFGKGTATFMIMGDKCTRRCPFCDVGHGRPDPLDVNEPENLAKTIAALKLKYVVITSVDRDDLRDGGSQHFVDCIQRTRELSPQTQIEILVPDFRGRDDRALEILKAAPPDVMNHNMETVPRLYKEARPGSDYAFSLNLLKKFKALFPNVPTKSGLMVGLGETDEEILQVMQDMRNHNIDMLTIGQYLAPSTSHIPVRRYVHPDTFKMFEEKAYEMGFSHAAIGAMVRSSYHADQQAHAASEAAKA
ncbi:MAG: lipoyl synthase [Burkholderiales bacterium 35-55-47]|jgi:lipoic acid synthetase|uniref:lipoyl synthase n=1 Tax=Limnohabitans sp. TaxID=1907725 RepID=UPI000BCD8E19|nr:lipoyl synthase [Limnohabitans sp.]OYY17766.1 MAG: lipoyl synthase [Burkholderiales bacterium 35-55-47]OYZ72299.1 MAG: lipoyl synthase [Burkholderiales bacterium 24-55-52]OZA99671.1 MAG: lipoyl synthase [Burkholderiales bacterium 39-55-53]HQR86722.1 lipoyl synthase [Limnohabitans sp.]HQS27181.1 lipoyl synthase [Limnohabitans sp.]